MIYEDIKLNKYSKIKWIGIHNKTITFRQNRFWLKRAHSKIAFSIVVMGQEMHIEIEADTSLEFDEFFLWTCKIRRFEYLFDGAFYNLTQCYIDNDEITEIVSKKENAYFQSEGYKHSIPIVLSNIEYKQYFIRWMKIEKKCMPINQIVLYANNTRGITADVRLALLAECYETFAFELEKMGYIFIKKRPTTSRTIQCNNCNNQITIKSKNKRKTLSDCLEAVIDFYGRPVFSTEYRRRKSLLRHIVATRNKIFHVKLKRNRSLKGDKCAFYAIKMDWMYRYIILCLITGKREKIDSVIKKPISKFEEEFSQLIYHV